jgi:UDP-N-acetylmuramoyl-tripeptide--D-alanyl-D-alanine ligase
MLNKSSKSKPGFFKSLMARQFVKFSDTTKYVAVTGSVGKTTAIAACEAILEPAVNILTARSLADSVDKNSLFYSLVLNNKSQYKKIFLELDETVDLNLLNKIKFKTLIMTRSSENEKSSLDDFILQRVLDISKDGLVILNGDDNLQKKIVDKGKGEAFLYGLSKDNHVWASNLKIESYNTKFEINYGVERVAVNTKLLGFHQVYPLLAAAAFALMNGCSLIQIKKGLEKLENLEHVFQPLTGVNSSVVIDDCGNGHYLAIMEALEALNQISGKKRIVILGQVDGIMEDGKKQYLEIARKIYKDKMDYVFLASEDVKMVGEELLELGFNPDKLFTDLATVPMIEKLLNIISRGDLVLVKGNNFTDLHEIVKKISKKN